MCVIRINDLVQGNTYLDAGQALYAKMVDNVNIPDKIILDMEGVPSLPTIFLNVSIGQYIDTFGVEKLKQRIAFSKITSSQADRIRQYILLVSKPGK